MIIIIISFLFILTLNIINYILFSIYSINDIVLEYTSEDPENIILKDKYKYRLLNYIINLSYPCKSNVYNINNNYDNNSSDLYIHYVIVYYNYIVKLLLFIIILLFIGFIYNMFNLLITVVNNNFCMKNDTCQIIFSEIYEKHTYIYYIIFIIFVYVYLHSYIYTYIFNRNVYKDLYDLYEGDNGEYQKTDIVVSQAISLLNNKVINNKGTSIIPNTIVIFLNNLKNISYKNLQLTNILDKDNILLPTSSEIFKEMIADGLINNYKFIIPNELANENNINILLKDICYIDIDKISSKDDRISKDTKEILGYKIFIYLIYNYVISYNKEDPFIIHKLNNIYLNIYENIAKEHILYSNTEKLQTAVDDENAKDTEQDTERNTEQDTEEVFDIDYINNLIDNIDNAGIKQMYNEIKCSYTIKLLMPENTKKTELSLKLHDNATLLLKYIKKYNEKQIELKGTSDETTALKELNTKLSYDSQTEYDEKKDRLQFIIQGKINAFADTFQDYSLENKTKKIINFNLYKLNFYLAIEMLHTVLFILIVLAILYKSNEYPFIEKYINIIIGYALLIIDEVFYSILGIYFI
jgi:hypothetical protein